ncbi:basic amino acid ABC transporter substrate-binding protein [Micromonospora chaiyaphumensis]|uniref:Amino acid ABC transporter substrate-binding protein, PAAT family n=1 Tax=Micromonospora chaiyaphumensis TaxID=307119 RepID=A0A1C4U7C0_9ACTN|nr:basic amino acid ABC transporter substrate-binding protein [Micromonospora chaiyaphumensis]SCE67551.1 amino acid ABC transporter substrate-binding protein, PAAT family [Micromonospora chaiyaphumensis]
MTFQSAVRRVGVVVAIAALAASAGCAKKEDGETQASGVKLVEKGKLTVCTHLPYAPFQSKDAGGKVVGFDVDVMDLVAKELGVEQAIVDTPFEGIKSGQDLNTGKCDAAAAGMTITEERQKVMNFSDPYFDATQAMLVKTGKPYKSLDDLRGKKVGVQAATTGRDYAKKLADEKGLQLVEFEDLAAEQQALANGQVEAAINDLPVWTEYIKEHQGGFEVTAEFDTGEQYGFSVKKDGNPELLKKINEVLAKAKQDGTYDTIYEKWIGKKPNA